MSDSCRLKIIGPNPRETFLFLLFFFCLFAWSDNKTTISVMRNSRGSVANGEATNLKRRSGASGGGSGSRDDVNSMSASRSTLTKAEKKELARPLARKDVFYSGSVTNLPEYQSQKSLASYRQSIISLPKAVQPAHGRGHDEEKEQGKVSIDKVFYLKASEGSR